jgi:hypothetical protein
MNNTKKTQKKSKKAVVIESQIKRVIQLLIVKKAAHNKYWFSDEENQDYLSVDKLLETMNEYLIFSEYSKTKISKKDFITCLENTGFSPIRKNKEFRLYFDDQELDELSKSFVPIIERVKRPYEGVRFGE